MEDENDDEKIFEIIERNVKANKDETYLTELGKVLVYIPLHPKYAKMLLESRKNNCLGYMLLIVCALSVDQLCINEKITNNSEVISEPKHMLRNKNNANVRYFYNFLFFIIIILFF